MTANPFVHRGERDLGSPLPPLPPKPRVRGRKPPDPGFDVRQALYLVLGVDLTAIDEVHALTLVSELAAYVKQTEEAYAEQVRQRPERQLRRRARELGFELRKI